LIIKKEDIINPESIKIVGVTGEEEECQIVHCYYWGACLSKDPVCTKTCGQYLELRRTSKDIEVFLKNYDSWKESMSKMRSNIVSHPNHYTQGKIECIDYIQDKGLNFSEGNAVKYITRARHKGKYVEDMKKAAQYIEFAIKHYEETNDK
jgi:sulfur relay (sulfurtransferase) DsrC/TusE family protein